MIAQLKGVVEYKTDDAVVIDVNGVGYEVLLTKTDYDNCMENETVIIHIHQYIRENLQQLYGFLEKSPRALFEQMLSVSGVGPKVALSILGIGDEQQIKSAIISSNTAYISSASGVGKKLAEKIIVELRDKITGVGKARGSVMHSDDAQMALEALGYSRNQAAQALAKVTEKKTEDRIKAALKELS